MVCCDVCASVPVDSRASMGVIKNSKRGLAGVCNVPATVVEDPHSACL